jgi:P pilus assembly chaperone PapD
MSFLPIIAAAVIILTGVFFFFFTRRKVEKRPQEHAGAVSCKKCGKRIAVSNPSKLHHEFSLKCTACDTRKLYKLIDLSR